MSEMNELETIRVRSKLENQIKRQESHNRDEEDQVLKQNLCGGDAGAGSDSLVGLVYIGADVELGGGGVALVVEGVEGFPVEAEVVVGAVGAQVLGHVAAVLDLDAAHVVAAQLGAFLRVVPVVRVDGPVAVVRKPV